MTLAWHPIDIRAIQLAAARRLLRATAGIQSLLRTACKSLEPGEVREKQSSPAAIAQQIGGDWKQTPYYDTAEHDFESQWKNLVSPEIEDCDVSTVVDLAAGHGRNAEKLRALAQKVYVVDINVENVEFCRKRFKSDPRVECLLCDGLSLAGIPDSSITLIYTFDSMVHFDSDTVRAYLHDFRRVLAPFGRAFCHHSAYVGNATGDFRKSPHWRNFMSKELFAHWAQKEGLRVIRQRVFEWGTEGQRIPDCFSLLEKA